MNLHLNVRVAENYKNKSQKARVVTEFWVIQNGYCPNCGNTLYKFKNNRPVADFYCKRCSEEFELKSKNAPALGNKIVNGAYAKMIERIKAQNNPNFFFLTYNLRERKVSNFLLIPNYYFIPDIIEKRNPLSSNARRAGWIGCNIDLRLIPEAGKVFYVKNSTVISPQKVIEKWQKMSFLKNEKLESKGWLMDVLNCIDNIEADIFCLNDVYKFEAFLKARHPNNKFIKAKIRQQLQLLRDKGLIEFLGRGKYKKVKTDEV